jgi:hypothetical protein
MKEKEQQKEGENLRHFDEVLFLFTNGRRRRRRHKTKKDFIQYNFI